MGRTLTHALANARSEVSIAALPLVRRILVYVGPKAGEGVAQTPAISRCLAGSAP